MGGAWEGGEELEEEEEAVDEEGEDGGEGGCKGRDWSPPSGGGLVSVPMVVAPITPRVLPATGGPPPPEEELPPSPEAWSGGTTPKSCMRAMASRLKW